jgi:hypothetical protein
MDDKIMDANRIVQEMEKQNSLNKVKDLIQDNSIVFDYKDKKYRVRLLNLSEKEELDLLRRRKFGQLIKDKDILLEKDLIIKYKERGINIDDLDEQIRKINSEMLDEQLKLGEAIFKNAQETILKTYKDKIEECKIKIKVISTQKNLLLELCLENALLAYVAQIITYLSFDIFEDGIWKHMFSNIDDFLKHKDEGLINQAATYSMLLQYL